MLVGGCACGGVRYEVEGDISPIIHCHCETCRKTHGSAFSSIASVDERRFRVTTGKDLLSVFESSPGKFRQFCSRCGSHVFAKRETSSSVMLRLGCLDTPIVPRNAGHIWRSDGASWYHPKVELPEYPEGYPASRLAQPLAERADEITAELRAMARPAGRNQGRSRRPMGL